MRRATPIYLTMLIVLSGCLAQSVPVAVTPVAEKPRFVLDAGQNVAAIKFDKVLFNLRRGDVVGEYLFDLTGCFRYTKNVYWNNGRMVVADRELSSLFFDEMKAANFNIIDDPSRLFQSSMTSEGQRPDYLVGAHVEQIKMRICDEAPVWISLTNPPSLDRQKGEASMRVRWQIFDVLNRAIVHEFVSEGYVRRTEGVPNGESRLVYDAFAAAARNLAADPAFVAGLLLPVGPSVGKAQGNQVDMRIERLALSNESISQNIDNVRLAVATLDSGDAHGSGFFIAPNLVLTNNHVVRGRKFIRIRLVTGRSILGEVIRTHEARDVALVQVEAEGVTSLPLRLEPLKVTEEVYAIGSPLDLQFAGTVTKGIVSRFNRNPRGLEDIQADVDIQGGNSGGCLLDKNGNVVGVSYAGVDPTQSGISIGLNFFIPIADALAKLNVSFVNRGAGR